MKIYPCVHDIKIKKQVSLGDIQLAYLQGNEENKNVTIQILEDFRKPYHKENVSPYQSFDTQDFLFFDQNLQGVDPTPYLNNKGTQFYVRPLQVISESVVHEEEKFTYSVLLQRQDHYKKSASYDIQVGGANEDIIDAIYKIYSNNSESKIYPENILFNHGSKLKQDFIPQNIKNLDFFFISLTELGNLAEDLDYSLEEYIDKLLMQDHVNLWITDSSFNYTYTTVENEEDAVYRISSPQIFASVDGVGDIDEDETYGRFYTTKRWNKLNMDTDQYVEFFSAGGPIQIVHRRNGGYVILSHPTLLTNSGQHVRLIIETIMYVYLNTYYQTETYSSFVTDDPIDYFININKKYGLCHPKINLLRILNQERFNTEISYDICGVITNNNAEYTGITRFSDLLFKKTSARLNDRSKGNNMLAYTSNKTLLIYAKDDTSLQLVESGVTIRNNGDMTLSVDPVYSSKYKIVANTVQTIYMPAAVGIYYLVYADGTFELVTGTNINHRISVAKIIIEDNTEITYRDVRIPGGGEWSTVPNYEMIDTGNLLGRPLRYGGVMIIQLPARFKSIQNQLQSEVEKHMTSGDYPILVFKD